MFFIQKKPLIILTLLVLLLSACGGGSDDSSDSKSNDDNGLNITSTQQGEDNSPKGEITPVYVTIYAHNEDNWFAEVNTLENYQAYRDGLVERLKLLQEYGADFSWQSDYVILEGMQRFEDSVDNSDTDDKHILKYMTDTLHFSAEPHSHITDVSNYADVAKLFEEMDINYNSVVGGWAEFTCGDTLYDTVDFLDYPTTLQLEGDGYIYGVKDSSHKWEPKILSTPSTAQHWWDGDASGVWYTNESSSNYYTPQSDGLIVVGQGSPADRLNIGEEHASGSKVFEQNIEYIKELVAQLKSGKAPGGKIYTASISTRDRIYVESGDITVMKGIKDTLEILKPYVERGEVIYADYGDVVQIWKDKYHEESNVYAYSNFTHFDQMKDQFTKYCNGEIRK